MLELAPLELVPQMNSDTETYFPFPKRKLWWQLDSRAVSHRCYWKQGLHPSCKSTYGILATILFFYLYCYWLTLFITGYSKTERRANQKVFHHHTYCVRHRHTLTFKLIKCFKTPPGTPQSWWCGSRGQASPASLQVCFRWLSDKTYLNDFVQQWSSEHTAFFC